MIHLITLVSTENLESPLVREENQFLDPSEDWVRKKLLTDITAQNLMNFGHTTRNSYPKKIIFQGMVEGRKKKEHGKVDWMTSRRVLDIAGSWCYQDWFHEDCTSISVIT